jgi:hypothetical protein
VAQMAVGMPATVNSSRAIADFQGKFRYEIRSVVAFCSTLLMVRRKESTLGML